MQQAPDVISVGCSGSCRSVDRFAVSKTVGKGADGE
jgi:hypothetical protein